MYPTGTQSPIRYSALLLSQETRPTCTQTHTLLTPLLRVSPPGKYVVFFFYPLDFTFVCPTEIVGFSDQAEEFRKIGCEVIGASTDSHFSHLAW